MPTAPPAGESAGVPLAAPRGAGEAPRMPLDLKSKSPTILAATALAFAVMGARARASTYRPPTRGEENAASDR
jgi:hypothetical protein